MRRRVTILVTLLIIVWLIWYLAALLVPYEYIYDDFMLIKTRNLVLDATPLILLIILVMAIAWINRNLLKSKDRDKALLDKFVGIILIILGIFLFLMLLLALPHSHEPPRRLFCARNLKQMWKALEAYAEDHNGLLPPIDETKDNFIMSGQALYPEYVEKIEMFGCSSDPEFWPEKSFHLTSTEEHPGCSVGEAHPDCITDMSYCYLGWIVTSDEEAAAFFEAYDRLSPGDYDKDIIVPDGKGNGGGNVLYRLKKDVGDFPETIGLDASQIPVMWDKPSADITNISHVPAGGNVLYLDGHAEFIRYDKKFPMTKTLGRMLDERPREPIPDCYECTE